MSAAKQTRQHRFDDTPVVDGEFGDEKKVDAPALGFSVQVDLGAGRTAVMQTHLSNDCSQVDLNRMFMKMNLAGDFQRAHYKIEEQQRQIEIIEGDMRQAAEDLERIDATYVKEQAQLDASLDKALAARNTFVTLKTEQHQASGKRVAWEPKGAEKADLTRVDRGVTDLQDALLRAKVEHDKIHTQHADLKLQRQKSLARYEADITRCKAVIDAGLRV